MNAQSTDEQHDRQFTHSAANRGLNRQIDYSLPSRIWQGIRFVPSLVYSLICIAPGLVIFLAGAQMLFAPEHPISPIVLIVIILVGVGLLVIGGYIVQFIWKNK